MTGNIIGLLADGITPGAVSGDGIRINSSESNTIGGTTIAARNIIAKTGGSGINLTGKYARYNTIAGNYIGTDVTGLLAAGNIYGVSIASGASNNTIGGASLASRNIISGNSIIGVLIDGATGISIGNNWIGVNAFGIATPNAIGVRIVNNSPSRRAAA